MLIFEVKSSGEIRMKITVNSESLGKGMLSEREESFHETRDM